MPHFRKPRPGVPDEWLLVVFCSLAVLIALLLYLGIWQREPMGTAWQDPYECYGGARYEAMQRGEPSCAEIPYYTRHRIAREKKDDRDVINQRGR